MYYISEKYIKNSCDDMGQMEAVVSSTVMESFPEVLRDSLYHLRWNCCSFPPRSFPSNPQELEDDVGKTFMLHFGQRLSTFSFKQSYFYVLFRNTNTFFLDVLLHYYSLGIIWPQTAWIKPSITEFKYIYT